MLIVTATQKSCAALAQFLSAAERPQQVLAAYSSAEARRLLLDSDFDLIVINTPLPDEFGHDLACNAAAQTTAGVLMLVKAEIADEISEKVEAEGVMVVPKPLNRALVFQAVRLLQAARRKLLGLQSENRKLQRKIEDIRLIDRAKCILIECRGMTEPEAHAYIEHEAMNRRIAKREIAIEILQANPFETK